MTRINLSNHIAAKMFDLKMHNLVCSECMQKLPDDCINLTDFTKELKSYEALCSQCKGEIILYTSLVEGFIIQLTENKIYPEQEKLIFDKVSSHDFNTFKKSGRLMIKQGYLARAYSGKVEFFHRYLLKNQFTQMPFKQMMLANIHHKNRIKLDNRMSNLLILSKDAHKEAHKGDITPYSEESQYDYNIERIEKAFRTWCLKVHGKVNDLYYSNFEDWIESKNV